MDGNNPNYRIITICHDLQERRVIDRIININKSVPAGYSAPFFIQDVLAADLFWREHFRISPLYRKCTPKAPFYTITVCRLQQPCYRNINSFLLVSAAISIRFVPFCPILSYLDWRWIVYITILIYFHRTTNTVIYYCILLL